MRVRHVEQSDVQQLWRVAEDVCACHRQRACPSTPGKFVAPAVLCCMTEPNKAKGRIREGELSVAKCKAFRVHCTVKAVGS